MPEMAKQIVRPGRNDQCPCGSGKKYKKCCANKPAATITSTNTPARFAIPATAEINELIVLLNASRFEELEVRAHAMLGVHQDSGLVWKVLGAALKAQGKDALHAMQKAAQFLPDDANVHINLGNIQHELGRCADAVTSFRRAIEIQPDDAFAHNNLGSVLKYLGHLDEAVSSYRKALTLKPDFIEAHYNLGNAMREKGKLEVSVASYRQVLKLNPNLAEAHCNLGTVLKDLGQLEAAVTSYRRALEINPNFAEAHCNMGTALKDLGQFDQAVASYRQALEVNPDFAEAHYNLGNSLQSIGQVVRAMACYRQALKINPDYAEALGNLGNALRDIGHLDDALTYCRRALEIKPNLAEAHLNLGNILNDLGQLDAAAKSFRSALKINPDFAVAHSNLGNVQHDLGQLEDAVASYRRALEIQPTLPKTLSNLGGVLMELGYQVEAKKYLDKAIELAPGDARPLATSLFYMPCQHNDPRLIQLEALYPRRKTLPLIERIRLCFAMGKSMKNIGEFDRSFEAYEEANRLRYQANPFDEAADELFLAGCCRSFTAEFFNRCAALDATLPAIENDRVPVFIVGMPRSGTTLIEQILASHPAIYGAGELGTLGGLAKRTEQLSFDSSNCEDTLMSLRKLGQEYLDIVWELSPKARYITDKMPANYRYLGLIHLMLPNAKIIHSMRDPMDTCLSCYALDFRVGHEYSYDLGMLGRHYVRYQKLMKHWHEVLPPSRMLDVHYESNVADPERKARRMLDYLGLPWDPACLRFYETKRAVRTPSVLQVQKPIYNSSVNRWKHFEQHLSPLLGIINDGAV